MNRSMQLIPFLVCAHGAEWAQRASEERAIRARRASVAARDRAPHAQQALARFRVQTPQRG